ncbi:uncharacterized protein DSM5745_09666 [Aspergillus mulundensis]|uniref:Uncharacterized protein n=1 Tax=Aspergillus mulundensis TaxID=1810919 RepID=A0A3D8QVX1_9EURO|nr:hypothetical protein DSM5745_09666 [Aspergillus mulundensis]RDW65927.1 hypothetical protein DSM5745_09666 [Aspergillus mulundensis]
MPTSSLPITCALVTGGGGIGKACSAYLIAKGIKVIIAGRTELNLQSAARKIRAAAYYMLDTGKTASIPEFIARLTTEHPQLDCLVSREQRRRAAAARGLQDTRGRQALGGDHQRVFRAWLHPVFGYQSGLQRDEGMVAFLDGDAADAD